MSQNIGAPCKPLVKKGDTVLVGQKIGDTDAFLHVPVHASVSGKVTGIETQRNAMGGMDTMVVIESDGQQTMDPEIKPPVVTNHKDDREGLQDLVRQLARHARQDQGHEQRQDADHQRCGV